ncbi:MAG: YqgE/AlgH family protein, partial [Planctomycetales bacterium]|nr:YqgE/AlgH family protein [Planctomycetales bacterium]
LLEHGEQGALGVVLNRVSDQTVSEVWDAIDADPCDCDQLMNIGGPVSGPLIALHTSEELSDKEVLPGLFMSLQRDQIDQLVRQAEHAFRLYSGNSGWGGGQLEGEMEIGGWLTTPAKAEDVFADPDDLWRDVTSRIGLKIMLPEKQRGKLPPDASLN